MARKILHNQGDLQTLACLWRVFDKTVSTYISLETTNYTFFLIWSLYFVSVTFFFDFFQKFSKKLTTLQSINRHRRNDGTHFFEIQRFQNIDFSIVIDFQPLFRHGDLTDRFARE